MNVKFGAVSVVAIVLSGMAIFSVAEAQNAEAPAEKKIVQMRTTSITPLRIEFDTPRLNAIAGKVEGPIFSRMPDSVVFTVSDRNGAEVWRNRIVWDAAFAAGQEGITVPFAFDVSDATVAGRFGLRVDIFDGQNKLIARGNDESTVLKREAAASITDLEIKKETGKVTGTFVFQNAWEEERVSFETRIREHSADGVVVGRKISDEVVVRPRETKKFTFEMPLPEKPESYLVEVQMQKGGEAFTGSLAKRVIVEGDFAEISAFRIDPARFLEAGETAEFTVAGVAREGSEPLRVELAIKQLSDGEVVTTVTQTADAPITYDEFLVKFSVPVTVPATQFTAHAKVLRGDKVIEEKDFNGVEYREPSFMNAVEDFFTADTKEGKSFEMWMVVMLTLVVVVLLFGLIRHHKKEMYLILLAPLMWAGTTYAVAENEWERPASGSAYSPDSTEGFQIMNFKGDMYDSVTGEGLLGGNLTEVRVEFSREGDDVSAQVAPESVEISAEYGDRYEFSLDLTASGVFDGINDPDGQWSVQVALTVDNTEYASNWDGHIVLDTTPPTVSFSVPEGATNQAVPVTISCTDEGGAGCLSDSYTVYVRGNFCDIDLDCNTDIDMRRFEICDRLGNCTDPEGTLLDIRNYDPIPPRMEEGGGVRLMRDGDTWRDGQGALDANKLEANEDFIFEITGLTDDIDEDILAEYADQFDTNACGSLADGVTPSGTYFAPRATLTWVTSAEGAELEGFEVERLVDGGGAEDWVALGFVPKHGSGVPYTFSADTIENASAFSFRLRIGGDDATDVSSGVRIGTPLAQSITFGTAPANVTVSQFNAQAGAKQCKQKEVLCAGAPYPLDLSAGRVCYVDHFGDVANNGGSSTFPLELPFTLTLPPYGEFPMDLPFFLGP